MMTGCRLRIPLDGTLRAARLHYRIVDGQIVGAVHADVAQPRRLLGYQRLLAGAYFDVPTARVDIRVYDTPGAAPGELWVAFGPDAPQQGDCLETRATALDVYGQFEPGYATSYATALESLQRRQEVDYELTESLERLR